MVMLVNNAMMYLFKEAKYTISDIEVESVSHLRQVMTLFELLTLLDDFSMNSGLRRCWSKATTNVTYSYKYHRSVRVDGVAVGAAVPAIPQGHLTPKEHLDYNQGFVARKSFIFSSNPKGSFAFTIPFSHIFGFSEYK